MNGKREARLTSTKLMAEVAFGDPLFGSTDELNASIEREARRARWQRRKASR